MKILNLAILTFITLTLPTVASASPTNEESLSEIRAIIAESLDKVKTAMPLNDLLADRHIKFNPSLSLLESRLTRKVCAENQFAVLAMNILERIRESLGKIYIFSDGSPQDDWVHLFTGPICRFGLCGETNALFNLAMNTLKPKLSNPLSWKFASAFITASELSESKHTFFLVKRQDEPIGELNLEISGFNWDGYIAVDPLSGEIAEGIEIPNMTMFSMEPYKSCTKIIISERTQYNTSELPSAKTMNDYLSRAFLALDKGNKGSVDSLRKNLKTLYSS